MAMRRTRKGKAFRVVPAALLVVVLAAGGAPAASDPYAVPPELADDPNFETLLTSPWASNVGGQKDPERLGIPYALSEDGRTMLVASRPIYKFYNALEDGWQEHVFLVDRVTRAVTQAGGAPAQDRWDLNAQKMAIGSTGRNDALSANDIQPSFSGDLKRALLPAGVGIVLWDLENGTSELVNYGEPRGLNCEAALLSDDGRKAAFSCTGGQRLYVRDLDTGELTELGGGRAHRFSEDNRYLLNYSRVHDLETGTSERVTVGTGGIEPNSWARAYDMSADGRYVVFASRATNLVPRHEQRLVGPDTGILDVSIFVRDRVADVTEQVFVDDVGRAERGGRGNHPYWTVQISRDGRYVHMIRPRMVTSSLGLWMSTVYDRHTGRLDVLNTYDRWGEDFFWAWQPRWEHWRFWMSDDGRYTRVRARSADDVEVHGLNDFGPAAGVASVEAVLVESRTVQVSGTTRFAAAVLAERKQQGSSPVAREVGAQLRGGRISYRPETGDLLLRWDLTSLPSFRYPADACYDDPQGASGRRCGPSEAGLPGVVYTASLQRDGEVIGEARATPQGGHWQCFAGTGDCQNIDRFRSRLVPDAGLWWCPAGTQPCRTVRGSVGTIGDVVTVQLPLERPQDMGLDSVVGEVDVQPDDVLQGLRLRAGLGDPLVGIGQVLDEIDLGDVLVPTPEVRVGVAKAGTPEHEVDFDTAVELDAEGDFAVQLELGDLDAGEYEVWARGCLATECHAMSTTVVLP